MAVKILTEDQVFKPVKIEVTFETFEQLQTFVKLYGNAFDVTNNLNYEEVTEKGIDTLMTAEEWQELKDIVTKNS